MRINTMDEVIQYLQSLPRDNCDKKTKELKEIVDVQCTSGNWDYDPYMHGMANGLIMAQSIIENKNPIFFETPDKWLCDSV
ncbi:MAG: hypothetical protein KAI79_18585 [Bacteroidales bacterium]|nr:hypothetical protein [Bacteroidales bacterium]